MDLEDKPSSNFGMNQYSGRDNTKLSFGYGGSTVQKESKPAKKDDDDDEWGDLDKSGNKKSFGGRLLGRKLNKDDDDDLDDILGDIEAKRGIAN